MHVLILILSSAILVLLALQTTTTPPPLDLTRLHNRLTNMEIAMNHKPELISITKTSVRPKRLIFYNRPPKTGSTTVRIAMKKALDKDGKIAAKCFNMIEWNEMAMKTIINRRDVDFYGCHTRLTASRYRSISHIRDGNVTFITNTRKPDNIILSAYLQENRDRNIAQISDEKELAEEIERYKRHVEKYPIDALYQYHGGDVPLTKCPVEWPHIEAMRRVAERYEAVIDLSKPQESAAMVQAVTGLKPDFDAHFNERTTDTSGKMLSALKAIDTKHRTCGNELVHDVLIQQFNVIKDRLMQNRCFSEESGTYKYCELISLSMDSIRERSRGESYEALSSLVTAAKSADRKW